VGTIFPALGEYLIPLGYGMIIGGIVQALIGGQPPLDQNKDNKNSYYFNGPANTTRQGAPVSLIYGRVLVGSQLISSNISIDQLIATT
jgi:predicted phage tail protein